MRELLALFENLCFGIGEDAVEAAEHGHGEHDFAVFGRAVWAAEEVGNVPDEADQVIAVVRQVRHRRFGT
jgi:hypothetical protein